MSERVTHTNGMVAGMLAHILMAAEDMKQHEPDTLQLVALIRADHPDISGHIVHWVLSNSPLFLVTGSTTLRDGSVVEHWGTVRHWGSD